MLLRNKIYSNEFSGERQVTILVFICNICFNRKYILFGKGRKRMPGVIFEGGSLRAVFSCGVMDALLEKDIMFPYCIGVSAGSADSASYISRQKGRNLRILEKYRNDHRYMGRRNLLSDKSMFGIQFVFRDIPNELDPFDMETFQSYTGTFYSVTTDAQTGESRYFTKEEIDKEFNVFCATCALPVAFPPIKIQGREYYDGGLSNPIPIDKSMKDGNKKHLIVLTRPQGYIKQCGRSDRFAARAVNRKYPVIAQQIRTRYKKYNETVRLCEKLEKEGNAVIIRPDSPMESFEKDTGVLRESYQMGYRLTMENLKRIKDLFNE